MDPADRDIGAYLAGVDQALEMQAAALAPSEELESQVHKAAAAAGVEAELLRYFDDDFGRMRWRAVLRTGRGSLSADVDPGADDYDDEYADLLWIAAFEQLGLEL